MKISIITPCLNRIDYIEEAVRSVMEQNYPDTEHIVIDGGSTDGTLGILGEYSHVNVISGPDQGMYEAVNKGLRIAHGDIVGFLNSDDLYKTNIFFEIAEEFRDNDIFAVVGGAIVFSGMPGKKEGVLQEFSPKGTNLLELATLGSPFFNAWFFRRSVFDKIGDLNSYYRIAADREFILRFALSGLGYITLNKVIYQYRRHAKSMTFDVDDCKLEQITKEHIYMTDMYLRQKSISRQARLLIWQERTQDTMEMAAHAFREGRLWKTFYFMVEGTRYDYAWVYKFFKRALHKLWEPFRRSKKLAG